MKIVQVENGFVHWDASPVVPDLEWAAAYYAPNIVFVEAPDYVFEGWAYDEDKEGDARFVQPIAPEGWVYDKTNGSFRREKEEKAESALKNVISEIVNTV